MSVPPQDFPLPRKLLELAGRRRLHPVWLNAVGAVTVRAGDGPDAVYIKCGPLNGETSAEGEAARLTWAGTHTTVPRVVDHGSDGEREWLVTAALPYRNAVDRRWISNPEPAVR